MIEGDIQLRGQNTGGQSMVPIMAHPPAADSDLTLDDWLQGISPSGKGIKLDFKSIESVEISLQKLVAQKKEVRCHLGTFC